MIATHQSSQRETVSFSCTQKEMLKEMAGLKLGKVPCKQLLRHSHQSLSGQQVDHLWQCEVRVPMIPIQCAQPAGTQHQHTSLMSFV